MSCSFPSKVVLGRTHIKDVAAKRKVELNSYIQSLMNASTDVSEVILQSIYVYLLLAYIRNSWFKVPLCFNSSVILCILSSILYFVMKKQKELME